MKGENQGSATSCSMAPLPNSQYVKLETRSFYKSVQSDTQYVRYV